MNVQIPSIDLFNQHLKSASSAQGKSLDQAKSLASVYFTTILSGFSNEDDTIGGFGESLIKGFMDQQLGEIMAQSSAGDEIVNSIHQKIIQLQENKEQTSAPLTKKGDAYQSSLMTNSRYIQEVY